MEASLDSLFCLTKAHTRPAAEMMSRAFFDYPLVVHFFPDPAERARKQAHSFQSLLDYGIRCGEVYATSPGLEAVAMWLPSARAHRSRWQEILSGNMRSLLGGFMRKQSRQKAYIDYSRAVHRRCAPFPHVYLQLLGVDPAHQGKGYASALLRPMFARLDEIGLPCFLETQAEKNVALYRHLSFEVVEEGLVPGSQVTSWAMLRGRPA